MERTFILKIDADNRDCNWRRNLNFHLGMLASESSASIQIFELSDTGTEEANKILITTDLNTKK